MKTLPQTNRDFTRLYQLLNGSIRAKLMTAGLELHIFDELCEFSSADEVAQRIKSHAENTRRFLDGLAMIDLIEKKDGRYRNLPETGEFLVSGMPTYLGPLFQMTQNMSIDAIDNLADLIRMGPPAADEAGDIADESLWAEGAKSGAGWVLGGMGRKIAGIVSALPEFPGFKKMLDLGGGHGVFTLYMVSEHESMKGTVFDQPAVVKAAEEFIREYELQDRVTVMGGDYLADDIGSGYDLIWASSTLNFVKYQMDEMMKKIYDALSSGGIFISFQDGMTHEQTRPDTMLGHVSHALTTGLDFCLDQGFVADAALRCGFRSVRSRSLETPMGTMDMDIARK